MKKLSLHYLVVFVCLTAFPVYAQPGKDSFIPEQLLPETTLAVCVFPDLERTFESLKQTVFYEALQVSAISPPDRPNPLTLSQNIASVIQVLQKRIGVQRAEIQSIFQHPFALALVDLFPETDPGLHGLSAEIVFIADVTDSLEALKNIVESHLVANIQAQEPTVEFGVESFAGINYYVLSNEQFQLSYAFLNTTFILSRNPETIRKIIAVARSPKEDSPQEKAVASLFDDPAYRAIRNMAEHDRYEARVYLNVQGIWHKLRPWIRQGCTGPQFGMNQMLLELLDQYGLRTVSWIFSLKAKGGYERMFWEFSPQDAGKDETSGLLSIQAETGNESFLSESIVPANIVYYGANRVDWLKTWQRLITMIDTLPSPQYRELFHAWVNNLENGLQVDLQNELLPALADEFAMACYDQGFRPRLSREPVTFEDFPCFFLIRLAHKHPVEQLLNTLLKFSHEDAHTTSFRDTAIYPLEISGAVVPVTVYAAFVRDFLVLSASQAAIESIITVSQQGGSLASSEDYQAVSAYLPDQGYAKGYLSLRRIFRRLQSMQQLEELHPLLATTAFAEHPDLSGMMWVTTAVNNGFFTEAFSMIGGPVVGAATLWLGLSLTNSFP